MIIQAIDVFRIKIPLKKPFKTALRTVDACEDIVIRLKTDCNTIGYGSAAPTVAITGESHDTIIHAIKHHIAPKLLGENLESRHHVVSILNSALEKNTSAKAAVDMAIYDAWCKKHRISLANLLGGDKKLLTTDMTISLDSPENMVHDAVAAQEQGFQSLKIKVGSEINLDLQRIKAIIKATSGSLQYRIDANQAWSVDDAISIICQLADLEIDIPFIEQPVKALNFEGLKQVRMASPLRILADESCFSFRDALKLAQMGACDLFNVKLMKTGGIEEALRIIDLGAEFGIQSMISSMLESKLGIGCAAAVASARPQVAYLDLDAAHMQAVDPFVGGVKLDGPTIELSAEPGHGITHINDLIDAHV